MEKIIKWFKDNWFLWLFIILFYIGLRLLGYDIIILNSKDRLIKSTEGIGDIPRKEKIEY
jgi:hypothetical protein